MAKKSTGSRSSNAARKPHAPARQAPRQAMLVRTSDPAAPSAAVEPQPGLSAAKASQPAPAAVKPTPKAVASAPATHATRPPAQTARTQATRLARAQATQRARAANLISAEHYGYVLNDLKLTGILAGAMFVVIIALHFILG